MPKKSNVKSKPSADSSRFSIKIGSVLYKVAVKYKSDATETLEQKMLRLARNEAGRKSNDLLLAQAARVAA